MLVLTRKIQESVIIGEDQDSHPVLKVIVLAIHGDRVKLGFETNDDVAVRRRELGNLTIDPDKLQSDAGQASPTT